MLKLNVNAPASANTRKPLSDEAKNKMSASRKTYDLNYTLVEKKQTHTQAMELKDQLTVSKDVCVKFGFPNRGIRGGSIDAETAAQGGIPAGVYIFPTSKDQAAVFRGAGMSSPKDKSVPSTILNKCTYEKFAELLEENGMIAADRKAGYKKNFKIITISTEPLVIAEEKGKDVISYGLFQVVEYTAEELEAFTKKKAVAAAPADTATAPGDGVVEPTDDELEDEEEELEGDEEDEDEEEDEDGDLTA